MIRAECNMFGVHDVFAVKKDTVTEAAKRREQEKERQEKIAETRRIAQRKHHSRSESRSPKRLVRVLNPIPSLWSVLLDELLVGTGYSC